MSDTIERLNAALEGRYQVEREIGAGGMATVFLARDLKHNRNVALKVLKPELAAVVGAERFLAEIETTANLQHPHILPLFDSGEADSFLFYVMPYVEGETLRDRIDREKQLPVDEALGIATAVAGALQTAHEQGVIHRDIKPGNILLSRGQPLVADFGIAIAVSAGGGGRLTETGLSLGTPYYMSPEQATGDQAVGPASDTFALACVLYEMLVGEPPYPGTTAQAVLGKIIQGVPVSATAIRQSVPVNVDAAIRKALEKLPADRFTGAAQFARALADPSFRHGEKAGTVSGAGAGPWKVISAGLGVATLALAGTMLWSGGPPDRPVFVERFSMPFEAGEELGFPGFAGYNLSPDGTMLVYRHRMSSGDNALMVRRWDELRASPVRETNGALQPALSPDGEQLAFLQGNEIKVLALGGGPVRTLGRGGLPRWSHDGYVYARGDSGAVRYPATGGPAEPITRLAEGDAGHAVTDVLPGDDVVLLFAGLSGDGGAEIRAADVATGEMKPLTFGRYPRYAASGHLVYLADGTLMGAPFDVTSLELTGPAVALVEDVAAYSLSETGKLFYTTGAGGGVRFLRQLVWVDRSGQITPIDPSWTYERGGDPNQGWSLSPDGSRIALREFTDDGYDIWIKQLDRGPRSRLTLDAAQDKMPIWSPDGRNVTFLSERNGNHDVWTKPSDGTGRPELVLDMEADLAHAYWSPDDEWLILRTGGLGGREGGRDIYAVQPGVDSEPVPLMTAEYDEVDPDVSPDGRWIVYTSNETGRYEVYVRPFPDVDSGRWQISVEGGFTAQWAHSGREIFFMDASRNMVSVAVDAASGFGAGPPEVLFALHDDIDTSDISIAYDVAPDDQRFVMASHNVNVAGGGSGAVPSVILVNNFFEELKARVPR